MWPSIAEDVESRHLKRPPCVQWKSFGLDGGVVGTDKLCVFGTPTSFLFLTHHLTQVSVTER